MVVSCENNRCDRSGTEKDELCAFTSLETTLRKPLWLPQQSKEILELLLCTLSSCENTLEHCLNIAKEVPEASLLAVETAIAPSRTGLSIADGGQDSKVE